MTCSPLCSIEKIALRTQACDDEQVIQRYVGNPKVCRHGLSCHVWVEHTYRELLGAASHFPKQMIRVSSCLTLLPQRRIRFACRCKRMRILAQNKSYHEGKNHAKPSVVLFLQWKIGDGKLGFQTESKQELCICIQLLRPWIGVPKRSRTRASQQ